MSALARVRAYVATAERDYADFDSLDRVFDHGEIRDLTLGDLREVLELAEIYADLRDS